jgi:hypothetical protein
MSMSADPREVLSPVTWALAVSGEYVLEKDLRWQRDCAAEVMSIADPEMVAMLEPEGFDDADEARLVGRMHQAGYLAGRLMLSTADGARPWPGGADPASIQDLLWAQLEEMDISLLPHGDTGDWLEAHGALDEGSVVAIAFDSSLALALLEHDVLAG